VHHWLNVDFSVVACAHKMFRKATIRSGNHNPSKRERESSSFWLIQQDNRDVNVTNGFISFGTSRLFLQRMRGAFFGRRCYWGDKRRYTTTACGSSSEFGVLRWRPPITTTHHATIFQGQMFEGSHYVPQKRLCCLRRRWQSSNAQSNYIKKTKTCSHIPPSR
jgi:hypothetical protein